MKLLKKIIIVFILIINSFVAVSVYAGTEGNFGELSEYESVGPPSETEGLGKLTTNILVTAISVARTAGVGIAFVILMVIAMKYMMAAPGDRADIKKNAIPFLIGAVVVFGSTQIIGIIGDFAGLI